MSTWQRARRAWNSARWAGWWLPGVWLVALAGCASGPGGATAPREAIAQLNLLAVPVALNLDETPEPDGFAVTIYAGSPSSPKAVPVREGTMEILMFDGPARVGENQTNPPLRTWSYSSAELRRYAVVNSLGTGYRLTLRWDEARPKRSSIAVLARHKSSRGTVVSSAPSTVTLGVK